LPCGNLASLLRRGVNLANGRSERNSTGRRRNSVRIWNNSGISSRRISRAPNWRNMASGVMVGGAAGVPPATAQRAPSSPPMIQPHMASNRTMPFITMLDWSR
jgi:hypothetical protein